MSELRRLVKTGLAKLGLEVRRIPVSSAKQDRESGLGEILRSVRIGGFELLVNSESEIPRLYEENPTYSTQVGRLAKAVSEKYPDAILLDIGANVGDTVATVRRHSDIPVICVEGEPRAFELLVHNITQFAGVVAHNVYLGERSERVPVRIEKQSWNATLVPDILKGSQEVELISLDDFLDGIANNGSVRILKVDTEGFDARIMRGGHIYIQACHPVILFEYDCRSQRALGENGLDALALLARWGYEHAMFYDWLGRLMVSVGLRETEMLEQLHEYADGREVCIHYYDVCLFHQDDADLAMAFIQGERQYRRDHSYR